MQSLKNIVIINDFDYVQGGASKVAIDTANLLVQNSKYNVYFFSGCSNGANELDNRINQICVNSGECLKNKNKISGIINGIYNIRARNMLNELLKSLDKDETIIHIHGFTKCLSCSVFNISFKRGFEVILTLHDYFTACPNGGFFNYKSNHICKLKGGSFKCANKNCDSRNYLFKIYRNIRFFVQNKIVKINKKISKIIYISDFSWNILKDNFNVKSKAKLIYNPISFDYNLVNNSNKKADYYLYVGRITKEKGVDIFCEAVSKLGVSGVVVGDGDEKNKLAKKYKNIEFVGWKSSSEVKEYMKNAKALIMPSRWYEGMPLTNLEALSVGVPAIVSNCCAASEISNLNYNTGLVFDINDKEDILKKMIDISNLKTDLSVLEKFNKNVYIENLISFYEDGGEINE